MSITRRQLLHRTGLLTAGTVLGPSFFLSSAVRRAAAETIGDRYLISLYLDGGNDGLNTVIPRDNGGNPTSSARALRAQYERARVAVGSGALRIDPGDMVRPSSPLIDANTGCEVGLHPGLLALGEMLDGGEAAIAIVQGCGYPAPNLSHEESRVIWQTANPRNLGALVGKGWIGRHIAGSYGIVGIPSITIGDTIAGELKGSGRASLVLSGGVENLQFPLYGAVATDPAKAALQALFAEAATLDEPLATIGLASDRTLSASDLFPAAAQQYLATSSHANAYFAFRPIGTALRDVAKIVYAVERDLLGTPAPRFFHVANRGYDTHASQGGASPDGQHFQLHHSVSESLRIFFDDLRTLGNGGTDVRDKVMVLIWSEFGRRIPQNDNGTDHGSQGPVFMIGGAGAIQSGLYGNHPDLAWALDDGGGNTKYSQNAADGFRSTDLRDVYGTILKHWVNLPPEAIDLLLPVDSATPLDFLWTEPNYDLGFI